MILDSPYKEGDLVKIYKNPQTEEELLGMACLKAYSKTSLPFILEEAQNEASQITYALDSWFVDWQLVSYKAVTTTPWLFREDKTQSIRRIYKIGL